MTFLSTGLLAGLIAAAIPIALHLLARQQPKRIVLPTTRFLTATLTTHRDRLKVRRWWLLAMRIFAIAMLALAFARPQINATLSETWFTIAAVAFAGLALIGLATAAIIAGRSKPLRYGLGIAGLLAIITALLWSGVTIARTPSATTTDMSPAAVAVVIDNSVRSSRRLPPRGDAKSETVLASMVDSATWFVNEQTADSVIAIIDTSIRPATFSVDRSAAVNRLERMEPIAQSALLAERLRAAIMLVRSSDLERKSVLMITDLTSPSFDDDQWEAAGLSDLLEQEPPVMLQVLDVGANSINNQSIARIELGDPTPPRLAKTDIAVVARLPAPTETEPANAQSPVSFQLEIYDTSSAQATGLPVLRNADVVLPKLKSVDRVTVKADAESVKALLAVPPLGVGTHHGMVRLMTNDEWDADNVQYLTLVVHEPRRLLIIGSRNDEATVLAGALTAPLAIDDPSAEYRIDIKELSPASIDAWTPYTAVILLDPTTPPPPLLAIINEYLNLGGHVVTLLGPSLTAPDDTNESFPEGLVRRWRVPEPGTFVDIVQPSHPSVASLRDVVGGVPWPDFRITQYWQLQAANDDLVIAKYSGTEHPFIVQRQGSTSGGTHLIVTTPMPALTPATRSWNQLFSGADAWPAFLLVRDLVQSVVYRDEGSHNVLVGQSTRIIVPSDTDRSPSRIAGGQTSRAQLFLPTGPPLPLSIDGGVAALNQLSEIGTYWIRTEAGGTGVSVNLSPQATDLTRIAPALLDDWLGSDNYSLVKTHDEIRQAEGRGQPTRSLYSTAILLMLTAFVLEQVLANRFYASRADAPKAIVAT